MDNYKLINNDGEIIILKNDKPCYCPFRTILMIPVNDRLAINNQTQFIPAAQPCSSGCVFFQYDKEKNCARLCNDSIICG
jgi:ankyrin repeat protein